MNNRFIITLLCAIVSVIPALGITTEYWSGTITDKLYNDNNTTIAILTGDVTITGTITIDNWTTLRIVNKTGKPLTISNGQAGSRNTPMFKVIGGSKLAFNYSDTAYDSDSPDDINNLAAKYSRITLDGGAEFTDMDRSDTDGTGKWSLSATTSNRFTVSMIQTIGAVEMFLVDICNYYGPDNFGTTSYNGIGAIGIAPPDLKNASGTAYAEGANLLYRYTMLKDCTIKKCKSRTGPAISVGNSNYLDTSLDPYNSERLITLENVTIQDNVAFCDKDGWGGIIRCKGSSVHSMKLINTTFEGNFSHGDGAGLWWNAGGHQNTKCTIDGCTFKNNRAMRNSGGLRLETTFEFTGNTTTVSNNECLGKTRIASPGTYEYNDNNKGNGGGIHIFGYGSSAYEIGGVGVTFKYSLPECLTVTDNYAYGQGGGIAFDFTMQTTLESGTRIESYFNGVTVTGNTSGMAGGGIYFNNTTDASKNYTFQIYLNSGTVNNNCAPQGGGIFVRKISLDSNNTGNITISGNTASAGNGGGIFLEDGDITLDSVDITQNSTSNGNIGTISGGGGLYVKGGSFTINSGSISSNTSTGFGGGVLINNSSTDVLKTVTLTKGDITQNEALYGGGIAAYGNISLSINDIKLENNIARNGGGIFAHGLSESYKALVNYASGLIRNNISRAVTTLSTAYGQNYTDVSGFGGGIYIGNYSSLSIANPSQFGIYANFADAGADDLFASGISTDVTLPEVSSLKLDGYDEAQVHKLFWAEDYMTADTGYNMGTYQMGSDWNGSNNHRYRDVLENRTEGKIYTLNFGSSSNVVFTNKYLSLTLGWSTGVISIVKNGLKDGDNALFKIYKVNDDNSETEYMTVLLSDNDKKADGSRSREVILSNDGTWKIVETRWSWAYNEHEPIIRTINELSTASDRKFVFTNIVTDNNPIHAESIVINKL